MFQQHVKGFRPEKILTAAAAVLFFSVCQTAPAATVCVNPTGASGCQPTISKAVAAAAAGDTIQVAAGTYKENVVIKAPLALIGAGSATTTIDATGLPNGVTVDGSGAAGLGNIVISGFTVQNANFQGILVENASAVTIWNNQILNNNKSLNVSGSLPTCPGLPDALKAGEDEDCGEGLHLTGVDHAVVSNNVIQNNSGGILISDDLGPIHDIVITGNLVNGNSLDCGITLASHSGMGVYHNTISGNTSTNNGKKAPGAGAGVGIFAPGPGSKAYSNVVVNNVLTGNGLPGVTMHNHAAPPGAPPVNFNDNVIIGNVISSNAADTEDAATPGPAGINIYSVAPMSGTIVTQNTISQETVDLAVNAPGPLVATLNNFLDSVGINSSGVGTVNATQNWWRCPGGPGTGGCAIARGTGVTFTPVLTSSFTGTLLPAAPGSGTTPGNAGVTIVVTLGGVTAANNTFQANTNQLILDASQSKSSNPGALSYSWSPSPGFPLVGGIIGANTATPTFQLGLPSTYQFTLTVTDSTGAQATTTVTVQYI
ncbi:MAG: right-handed parallel beta-helix repeat-containing protein [Acidobacteriia bacterium]|nr:right-handed parallel beta-helix repeat-containing protein [Terriglobia bacterium]